MTNAWKVNAPATTVASAVLTVFAGVYTVFAFRLDPTKSQEQQREAAERLFKAAKYLAERDRKDLTD